MAAKKQNSKPPVKKDKFREEPSGTGKATDTLAKRAGIMNMPIDGTMAAVNKMNNEILDVWMDDVKSALGTQKWENLKKMGTAIPFIYNVAGDLLVNPSTVSPSTFKKMVETDSTIALAITNNINGVINTISKYLNEEDNIQDFGRLCISRNRRGFRTMCRDIMTGLHQGFSRQECVWDWDDEADCDVIVETQPLPQNSIIYRVDPYGDIDEYGVGQYVFNSFFPGFASLFSYGMGNVFAPILGQSGSYGNAYGNGQYIGGVDPFASEGDMDTPYRTYLISPIGLVWIPTNKTIGYEYYGMTNGKNPYGKSFLRPVYNLWIFKLGLQQFFMQSLMKKANPLLVGFARMDVPVGEFDPQNPDSFITPNQNPFGPGKKMKTAVQGMSEKLENVESTSAVVFPGMKGETYDLEMLDISGDMGIFLDTLRYLDECILTGLFTPTTTVGGGEGGSYALSYSHSDASGQFKSSIRRDLIECLIQQYMRPQIEEKFTPEEHKYNFGTFEVEMASIDDQVKLSTIYKTLIEDFIADMTNDADRNRMREIFGFAPQDKVPDYIKKFYENGGKEGASADKKREKLDSTEKPYNHEGK